jgi:site-specific DNA-methyltransferase (adenine-specific)
MIPQGLSFSDGEMAWTSFDMAIKKYTLRNNQDNRIHPTQKPVQLYKWILTNYAKQGDKILDTHLGSGSIAMACHELGFDLTACEIDQDYFDKSIKRLNEFKLQTKLL